MNTVLPKPFQEIVGSSPVMMEMKERAYRVSLGNSTVLITGETGTGKGLFAQAIHRQSRRKDGPFVEVNCGAIPENLIESELFGYTKGAFTGALREGKKGRFLQADKGTIFLDEIGEMPLHLQVKLLQVLQNRTVEPIGAERGIGVDLRIVAASNQDLEAMIEARKFRKDLYFRLGVIPIHIPPLCERKEDIPELARFLFRKILKQMGRQHMKMEDGVIRRFCAYSWPGNVRELENTIEYAINMSGGDALRGEDLPDRFQPGGEDAPRTQPPRAAVAAGTYQQAFRQWERELFRSYLEQHGNDKKAVARALDISVATLYRKLAHLGLDS